MASSQVRRVAKINGVLDAVKANNWASFNQFILAYYTSKDPAIRAHANRSLTFVEGQTNYFPEQALDAWLENVPDGSKNRLQTAIAQKAATIITEESTTAIHSNSLREITSSNIDIDYLTTDFGLKPLAELYQKLLPCLWLILFMITTAQNDYERKKGVIKVGKDDSAIRVLVVVISMLLFTRNRATDAFQLIFGIFLASAGASRRVMDTCNHMALSVSYSTIQRCLIQLTESAKKKAHAFVRSPERLYGVVYDNINFTLRKSSQRLDNRTEQLNATTSAVFSLPVKFTRAAYQAALSVADRNKLFGSRRKMNIDAIQPTSEEQQQLRTSFCHQIRSILLRHAPGLDKHGNRRERRRHQTLTKQTKRMKPVVRLLSSEQTLFYPLPALDQEEASVSGTIKVVTRIFTELLGFAVEVIDTELRLMVGDWLTIRNLRLMRDERMDEFISFERMDWVLEASMPFHFQLNAMYMLYRTHLGHSRDNDPGSLEHHWTILRRAKLDVTKPEYNKAKELLKHSLAARVLDCTRILLKFDDISDLKDWAPTTEEFNELVTQLVDQFTTGTAGHAAMDRGDEVLAHAIFFMRDALTFVEFEEAVRDADVGRMWTIYSFWLLMMRGAGCHNYGNELLEIKAQFTHELPLLLRDVVERSWLVNRWGQKGRSIPTDLYLEHNNGFIKNTFTAHGSGASMEHVQQKSSGSVEVLRSVAREMTSFFGVSDHHRKHTDVSIANDIKALCADMKELKLHTFESGRLVPPAKIVKPRATKKPRRITEHQSGVRDILQDGFRMLTQKRMFDHWLNRTGAGGVDLYGGDAEVAQEMSEVIAGADGEENPIVTGTVFDDPNGTIDVDYSLDVDLADESSFANLGNDIDDE